MNPAHHHHDPPPSALRPPPSALRPPPSALRPPYAEKFAVKRPLLLSAVLFSGLFSAFGAASPGLPTVAAEASRSAEVAAPSVPLDTLRARSRALHQQQAQFAAKLAAGDIKPFPEIRERWPQIVADNRAVLAQVDELNAMEPGSPARPAAQAALFDLLQGVGPYLQSDEHPPGAAHRLTPQEAATLRALGGQILAAQSVPEDPDATLDIVSPRHLYTLIHLPVPLAFTASPGQDIHPAPSSPGTIAARPAAPPTARVIRHSAIATPGSVRGHAILVILSALVIPSFVIPPAFPQVGPAVNNAPTASGSTTCVNNAEPGEEGKGPCPPEELAGGTSDIGGGDFVSNGQLHAQTSAPDFSFPGTGSGCSACAAAPSSQGGLPALNIARRYRSSTPTYLFTSFGQLTALEDYDRSLYFPSHNDKVHYHDPARLRAGRHLTWDSSRVAWAPSVEDKGFFGLFLYDALGASILNPAHTATLLHHDGSSEHFEIAWQSNGQGFARPTALMDRNGNAITIGYVNPQPYERMTNAQ